MADYACPRCRSLNVDISRSASRGEEWLADCGECGHVAAARDARRTAETFGLRIGLPPHPRFLPVGRETPEPERELADVLDLPDQQAVDRVVSITAQFSAGLAVGTRGR